eukprot:TRINITY_DN18975_c0_g2_i1.p3 TRINITY_DN18975_c0_g2~~TRINITY_DN18975_c0_g2_i1.p3  ORF type:complete len:216 (-),score=-11.53 TRINITY_DN18975_c0_g2_i1:693-1340(-)
MFKYIQYIYTKNNYTLRYGFCLCFKKNQYQLKLNYTYQYTNITINIKCIGTKIISNQQFKIYLTLYFIYFVRRIRQKIQILIIVACTKPYQKVLITNDTRSVLGIVNMHQYYQHNIAFFGVIQKPARERNLRQRLQCSRLQNSTKEAYFVEQIGNKTFQTFHSPNIQESTISKSSFSEQPEQSNQILYYDLYFVNYQIAGTCSKLYNIVHCLFIT